MPYVKPEKRTSAKKLVGEYFAEMDEIGAGDLNYLITRIIHEWLIETGIRYDNLNTAIGVLTCVKDELYRTVVAGYEDVKKEENGFISVLDE